jgi:Transglutaminase-like superfamily
MQSVILSGSIFFCFFLTAQPKLPHNDFALADSIGLHTKYKKDIIQLSKDLTQSLPDTLSKVRAIYRWIINNISYDVKSYNKGKLVSFPVCNNDPKCEYELRQKELLYLKKRIKKRKAVCDGYSRLFHVLCEYAGIQSEIVTGGYRTKPYQLDGFIPRDHAWNAVLISNTWYFIDATWAAGSCVEDESTGKLLLFIKREQDLYFLTPYEKFIKDHHPDKPGWLSLLNNTTAEQFKKQPFYYDASHTIKYVSNLQPGNGILTAKVGDTITFKIEYEYAGLVDSVQMNSNIWRNPKVKVYNKKKKRYEMDTIALKKQKYIPFKREDKQITFKYVVTDRSLYYFDVLFKFKGELDGAEIVRYKIKIPWVE